MESLKTELSKIVKDEYDGFVKKNEPNLLMGLMDDEKIGDFPIVTEIKRLTRSTSQLLAQSSCNLNENKTLLKDGKEIVQSFAQSLIDNLNGRIAKNAVSILMKDSFKNWDQTKLCDLLDIAESSGRSYGERHVLLSEFGILKDRFVRLIVPKDDYMAKWLLICNNQKYYKDISNILHFALCCFVKSPLEATAESIGSVINSHRCKERCSLLPSTLANEVQIVWNGPPEFHPDTKILLNQALHTYFESNSMGMRFYARTKLSLISSTISKYISEKARIRLD